MEVPFYVMVTEAKEAVEAAVPDHPELHDVLKNIVHKAWRSAYEQGLNTGSRKADRLADAAFAKGFSEGAKHASNVVVAVMDGAAAALRDSGETS